MYKRSKQLVPPVSEKVSTPKDLIEVLYKPTPANRLIVLKRCIEDGYSPAHGGGVGSKL